MSKSILHTAESRGTTNQGWFHSRHTFSFGDYYNPEQMHFGELRVINDNILAPGKGFGMHPHSNMEVVTIPLLTLTMRHPKNFSRNFLQIIFR